MHAPVPALIPPDLLLLAYRNGIFPMADSRDDPEIFWVEPRERAIIPLDGFHCSKSLAKLVRQGRYRVTIDEAFPQVVEACAEPRPGHPESWISARIAASYRALHEMGHAHSLECWHGEELVGGLYGVSFERTFCGESMFSRADNASKVALAWLVALMRRAGYRLLDCQFMTGHLASLGAVEIPQADYLKLLAQARGAPACSLPEAYSSVVAESADAGEDDGEGEGEGSGDAAGSGARDAAAGATGKLIAQFLTQTS